MPGPALGGQTNRVDDGHACGARLARGWAWRVARRERASATRGGRGDADARRAPRVRAPPRARALRRLVVAALASVLPVRAPTGPPAEGRGTGRSGTTTVPSSNGWRYQHDERALLTLQPTTSGAEVCLTPSKAVKGLRDRLSDTEDRLGKALPGFARKPVLDGCPRTGIRRARERLRRPRRGDRCAEHPVGRRHRTPDAPAALGPHRLRASRTASTVLTGALVAPSGVERAPVPAIEEQLVLVF